MTGDQVYTLLLSVLVIIGLIVGVALGRWMGKP